MFFISQIASPPRQALPEGVEDTILAEIIGHFPSDEVFSKSKSLREQCAHGSRILPIMHTPPVPFAAIVHYSVSIRAQFVNTGKISRPKKMFSGCRDLSLF
jgi:hypothetical protein